MSAVIVRNLRIMLEKSEAANRALQAEVDRLRHANETFFALLCDAKIKLAVSDKPFVRTISEALAEYTGHEPQQGGQT